MDMRVRKAFLFHFILQIMFNIYISMTKAPTFSKINICTDNVKQKTDKVEKNPPNEEH
jgi:hypothetical protein